MRVTFKANAKVLGYEPGKIYTEELTPLVKALLEQDVHLNLIDPPSLVEGYGRRKTTILTTEPVTGKETN